MTTDPPELLGLPYSPWSERARWALDACGVAYQSRTFQPLLGEPALRLRLRRWTGVISVPVLTLPDGRCLADSTEIARWADAQGTPRLFPASTDLGAWLALADRGLEGGRARALRRMLHDDEALLAMVPRSRRGALGGLGRRIAAYGIRRVLRKYAAPDDVTAAGLMDAALDALRAALGGDPRGTVLGTFSYADIAMAQVLVFVRPPELGPMRFSKGARRVFTDPERVEKYADLLAWRDALYAERR